jgi:hypothetical protein
MLRVTNKPFMLSVIMLNVVMLSVVLLSVIMLNVVAPQLMEFMFWFDLNTFEAVRPLNFCPQFYQY